MMDTGKELYDSIAIPDDKLIESLKKGQQKWNKKKRMLVVKRSGLAVAACFALLLITANVPAMYAYASNIPVIKTLVQALRNGSGGENIDQVSINVSVDERTITFQFLEGGLISNKVLSYSTEFHYAPARMEFSFYNVDAQYKTVIFNNIKNQIHSLKACKDIYMVESLDENTLSFVVQLKQLYNYELIEYNDPGEVTIQFYQDAYYTDGEKRPGQTIYLLRSSVISSTKEIQQLLKQYQNEEISQIKNEDGGFIFTIGEYNTKDEAKKALSRLQEEYGHEIHFTINQCAVEQIPK